MRLLQADSRVVEPWKNGRGRTATVDGSPKWRVSVAEVSDASPFSSFPGCSRILMPLSHSGVVLSVNGECRAVSPFQTRGFEGDDAVFPLAIKEPIDVLNLVWRRRACHGHLASACVTDSFELKADAVLIAVVTAGRLRVARGISLGRLDALRLDDGEAVTFSGTGRLALARIRDEVVLGD